MSSEYIKKIKGFEIKKDLDLDSEDFEIIISCKKIELIEALYEKILEWIN